MNEAVGRLGRGAMGSGHSSQAAGLLGPPWVTVDSDIKTIPALDSQTHRTFFDPRPEPVEVVETQDIQLVSNLEIASVARSYCRGLCRQMLAQHRLQLACVTEGECPWP